MPGRAEIVAFAMADDLGGALESAHLAHACDRVVRALEANEELEILVGVDPRRIDRELRHVLASLALALLPKTQTWTCPAFCWIVMTMNSAGLSGANPTTTLTMPRLMSFCVVVSESTLTK